MSVECSFRDFVEPISVPPRVVDRSMSSFCFVLCLCSFASFFSCVRNDTLKKKMFLVQMMNEDGTIDFGANPSERSEENFYEQHVKEIKRRETALNAPGMQNTDMQLPYPR